MKKLFFAMAMFLALAGASTAAAEKMRAVLMPVSGALEKPDKEFLAGKLSEKLGKKYEVVSGREVDRFVMETLKPENQLGECDMGNCYQKIGGEFKADSVISLRVLRKGDKDYLMTLQIYDLGEGIISYNKSVECAHYYCSMDKLAQLLDKIVPAR